MRPATQHVDTYGQGYLLAAPHKHVWERRASLGEDMRVCVLCDHIAQVEVTPPLDGHRGGDTFDVAFDYDRLNRQARRVYDVMRDGTWRTLREIADETGDPEASVSARLRDLRKQRFGALNVERRREHGGTWIYRVLPPEVNA